MKSCKDCQFCIEETEYCYHPKARVSLDPTTGIYKRIPRWIFRQDRWLSDHCGHHGKHFKAKNRDAK